jgi:hypothetical protein
MVLAAETARSSSFTDPLFRIGSAIPSEGAFMKRLLIAVAVMATTAYLTGMFGAPTTSCSSSKLEAEVWVFSE